MVIKLNGDIIGDKTADFCLRPTLDADEGRMCGYEGDRECVRGRTRVHGGESIKLSNLLLATSKKVLKWINTVYLTPGW